MFKLSKADRTFIETNRGCYDPDPHWYAAMTHWGRERQVRRRAASELAGCGLDEVFLPEIIDPFPADAARIPPPRLLFGGYLFFRCRMSDEIYLPLSSDPFVYKIFGRAFRIPTIIDDEEMRLFRAMLTAEPRPALVTSSQCGARVRVSEGLLQGLQGRIVEVSARFVKIEVDYSFLDQGSSVMLSVPRAQICLESPENQED